MRVLRSLQKWDQDCLSFFTLCVCITALIHISLTCGGKLLAVRLHNITANTPDLCSVCQTPLKGFFCLFLHREASFPFNINILNEKSPKPSEALVLKRNISRGRRNLARLHLSHPQFCCKNEQPVPLNISHCNTAQDPILEMSLRHLGHK